MIYDAQKQRVFGVWEVRSPNGEMWLIPNTDKAVTAPMLEELLRNQTPRGGEPYLRVRYQPPITDPTNFS